MKRKIWGILFVGILSATVLGLTYFARRAEAPYYGAIWTAAASTAAIDEGSLYKYDATGGILSFRSGQIGTILARINVLDGYWAYQGDAHTMTVSYWDPDGAGTKYRVVFELYRISRTTGVSYLVKAINSNSYLIIEAPYTVKTGMFSHAFDFINNAYIITITLYRYDTLYNPRANYVSLWWTLM